MRILLLSPPYLPEYMRNARCDFVSLSASQWWPILLGYAGAYLESRGHDVTLIDAPSAGLDHAAAREAARRVRPDLVVLYTGRMSEDNDITFAEELGFETVIVGPFAGIDPEGTLGKCRSITTLVVGEFEIPVGEIAAGRDTSAIPNLVYRRGHEILRTERRAPLTSEELDRIPFVSGFLSRQLDWRWYRTPSEYFPFMDVLTGRGCAYGRCTYCLWVHTFIEGPCYTTRSAENVIEELDFIAATLPHIRSVMFQDDTLTAPRARELSEAKITAGNRLPWSCYSRGTLDFETLRLMKEAGCRNLHVGYESADPEVLETVRKGVSRERLTAFTRDARRAGLRIHADFAFGFPGETPESAERTIEWACRLNPDTAQFQLLIPFPGTPYHRLMQERGWLNAAGEPDMPQFPNELIRATAKRAYRRFYLSRRYLLRAARHPYEHFFGRLKTVRRAIPAMFWKRW